MTLSLIADAAVAALLVVAIVYAIRLNRQLVAMQKGKSQLEAVASSFMNATGRAGDSIARLKTSAQQLQEAVGKAEALRDDIAFLLERGTAVADRLEGVVRSARKEAGTGAFAGSPPEKADEDRAELVADRVLRAGGRVVPGPGRSRPAPAERTVAAAPAKPAAPPARSDAERDLMRAIRAAR